MRVLLAGLCPSQNCVRTAEPCQISVRTQAGAQLCVVLQSAIIASNRRLGGSDSDFPPPVKRQGVSSSSRARPLFWLCQSPSPAVISVSGQQCVAPLRNRSPRRRLGVFFASSPTFAAPPFKSHHLAQTRMKTQSPRSIAQRACSSVRTRGLPRLPLPHLVCLSLLYRGPAFQNQAVKYLRRAIVVYDSWHASAPIVTDNQARNSSHGSHLVLVGQVRSDHVRAKEQPFINNTTWSGEQQLC